MLTPLPTELINDVLFVPEPEITNVVLTILGAGAHEELTAHEAVKLDVDKAVGTDAELKNINELGDDDNTLSTNEELAAFRCTIKTSCGL
jgi:hypothetical protein